MSTRSRPTPLRVSDWPPYPPPDRNPVSPSALPLPTAALIPENLEVERAAAFDPLSTSLREYRARSLARATRRVSASIEAPSAPRSNPASLPMSDDDDECTATRPPVEPWEDPDIRRELHTQAPSDGLDTQPLPPMLCLFTSCRDHVVDVFSISTIAQKISGNGVAISQQSCSEPLEVHACGGIPIDKKACAPASVVPSANPSFTFSTDDVLAKGLSACSPR